MIEHYVENKIDQIKMLGIILIY